MAIGLALGASITDPDFRNPRGIVIPLVVGAGLGLLIFTPIAAGEAIQSNFVRRHFRQFDRWSAFFLALGLGHLLGLKFGDVGIAAAMIFIILSASFRVFLSNWAKQHPLQ
jgi:hypothetical protein